MKQPRNAFTLLEAAITVFLIGVLSAIGYYYLNVSQLKKSHYKSSVQSHLNLIESMVFQCKSLSEQFPLDLNTSSLANDTLLQDLECNTSTPYAFDGGRNGFVPQAPDGFGAYRATESGTSFYIMTTADNNSTQDEALISLSESFTTTQATLEHNATSAIFKLYLSR